VLDVFDLKLFTVLLVLDKLDFRLLFLLIYFSLLLKTGNLVLEVVYDHFQLTDFVF
jgi:hypothetical protein